uniref:Matrix-remodeling-associated protein 7 helical domain-containing protein n=2 Tax=Strongyloides stercoralis TaxID=6248 RepID=A0A0K0DV41_STRER
MEFFKLSQEPYFFTILFLTLITATAISFLFFKFFNTPQKKSLSSKKNIVKENSDNLLKGKFNGKIQFKNKKMNNNCNKSEIEIEEKKDIDEVKPIECEEKVEECTIEDITIDSKDIEFDNFQDKLSDSEEKRLSSDIIINNIVNPQETIDVFSKIGELHGKLATAKTRIEARNFQNSLTEQEKKEEESIKEKQLKEIFEMLQAQEEKFGIHSKSELEEQFKFYAL